MKHTVKEIAHDIHSAIDIVLMIAGSVIGCMLWIILGLMHFLYLEVKTLTRIFK